MKTFCSALIAASLVLLPPGTLSTALAAPGSAGVTEPDPDTKAKARKFNAKGQKHHNAGRYQKAIAAFRKAFSLWKNPRLLINIALCYSELRNAVQAVTHLRQALRLSDPSQRVYLRARLPDKLKARLTEVADLEVVMPAGAEIFIDGRRAGPSPIRRVLDPATVSVVVKKDGRVKLRRTLVLKAGVKTRWRVAQWPGADHPKPRKRTWLQRHAKLSIAYAIAGAVLTLAGAGALVYTGLRTEQLQHDYYETEALGTRSQGIRYRIATNVLIGVSIGAAVTTAVLALFTRWKGTSGKREKATTTILPSIHGRGLGLSATGRF